MSYDSENPTNTCPWPTCRCTHIGCVAGWLDTEEPTAKPCPTCRPEVAAHMRQHKPADKLRRELPHLPRPTRHGGTLEGAA